MQCVRAMHKTNNSEILGGWPEECRQKGSKSDCIYFK